MREFAASLDGVEDGLLVGGDRRAEGLGGAVDGYGRRSEGAQLPADVADAEAGAALYLSGDGERGEHDGQVGFDGVSRAHDVRFGRVRPSHGHGVLSPLLVEKEHPVIAPGLTDTAKHEPLAEPRMERMGYENSSVLTVAPWSS